MTTTMALPSTSSLGIGRQPQRPTSSRSGEKQAIWIPMLQSSSKGKGLIEKQLIILGGSSDQQREFLEQLNPQQNTTRSRFNQARHPRTVPISNKYAMGYTYHDVLDTDQEDVLARMNRICTSPQTIIESKDGKTYTDKYTTRLVRTSEVGKAVTAMVSLDDDTKIEMEENMTAWKEKRTGPDAQKLNEDQKNSATAATPLGSGEWDEGLGFPLSVVCIQSEKIEKLEREQAWEEDHFDFLLQWLRTVLLKHGSSLCYVASFDANDVRTLLHSTLNIQSLLKREVAKHNVIDRDKILVPPNWDSWGKIRILRDAFEPETIAERWSIEIQSPPDLAIDFEKPEEESVSAVALYEINIPKQPQGQSLREEPAKITVTVPSLQEFLQEQKAELDRLAAKDDEASSNSKAKTNGNGARETADSQRPMMNRTQSRAESHHINVNGIDVDAEEATRRLREREEERKTTKRDGTPIGEKKIKITDTSTEEYKNFFAGLMNKKSAIRGSSPASGVASPRRGTPTPEGRTTSDHS
ncbi:hypothetical protein LTR64_007264 [Lithohypha guttulata]|uniref:uncharacterized protein n=1 Tax=Lithohypha guttulata TaxID=1690604 RepID=UPI002DDF3E4C|nr:hypothetical protein LTR51_004179 [Lithohypha guttulata]